jgi:hypothetical protein
MTERLDRIEAAIEALTHSQRDLTDSWAETKTIVRESKVRIYSP